jgi:hypothetical protein
VPGPGFSVAAALGSTYDVSSEDEPEEGAIMRGEWMSLVLLVAAGCSTGPVDFVHQSSLETRTRGVALLDDSPTAQVGMGGNTCEVQTDSALIGADFDVAVGEDDHVQDVSDTGTIVVGDTGVYILDPDGWGAPTEPAVDTSGVSKARFSDDGIVTLENQNGSVGWYGANGSSEGRVDLPADAQVGTGFAVDGVSGAAYVGSATGVIVATRDGGATTSEGAGRLVAWDAVAAALYVGDTESTQVHALESDGAVRWTVDVGGVVTAVDDMGGMAAVMVDRGAEGGELLVLAGADGSVVSSLATPSAADEVVVGNDGGSMAMVLPTQVHFFRVDLTAGE